MALVALDTMTGPNGQQIVNHQTDVPAAGVWGSTAGSAMTIQSNELQNVHAGATVVRNIVQTASAQNHEEVDVWFRVRRGSAIGTNVYVAMAFRANGVVSVGGERWILRLRTIDAADAQVSVRRIIDLTDQEQSSEFTVPFPQGGGIKAGVTLSGGQMQMWYEPYAGGARTLVGTPYTPSTTWNDAGHRTFGYITQSGGTSVPSQVWLADDLTIETLGLPPTAPTITVPAEGSVHNIGKGQIDVRWDPATDPESQPLTYEGDYSPDNGQNWIPLFPLQSAERFLWNIGALALGAYQLRVRAYDGTDFGPYDIANFTIIQQWAQDPLRRSTPWVQD